MSQYIRLPEVYDSWMRNIDYSSWWGYLSTTFSLAKGMYMLELGCGTGNLTEHAAKAGLRVLASDLSLDMLTVAETKLREYKNVRLMQLDMRRLPESLGQFDAIVAACDVVNYLRGEDELDLFLAGARKLLKPEGVLLFDLHGPARITEFKTNPYYNRVSDSSCYLWHAHVVGNRITHRLTGFVKAHDNLYKRFDETHRQYYFDPAVVCKKLSTNSFSQVSLYNFLSTDENTEHSVRIQVIARQ